MIPETTPEAAIYSNLRGAILEHRLPAGTRLVEDQLARAYSVSRARIRAVLSALARDRMVTLQRNRGACVSYPSPDEAREVMQARRLLESAITRAAAQGITRTDLKRLRTHVALEREAERQHDTRTAIKLSGNFHLLVAELVGNATLTGYLGDLIARSSLAIAVYEPPGAHHCSIAEHELVIAALATGKPDQAVAVMDEHLAQVERRLVLDHAPGEQEFDIASLLGHTSEIVDAR